jgi:hypothetical protein
MNDFQPTTGAPNTAYEIEYRSHPEYLHARVAAEHIDRTTSQSFLSDVLMECARQRRKKLLLERANAGSVVESELAGMMADLLKMNDTTQIAFLNRHLRMAEEIADVVAYGASVGGNYKCFNSFKAAEQWLLEAGNN